MAEYIEREALLERLKRRRDSEGFPKIRFAGLESAIFQVKHLPSADVVEVRHGEWVRRYNDFVYWYECSLCGDRPLHHYGEECHSAYCPNCGAKMDGKGECEW